MSAETEFGKKELILTSFSAAGIVETDGGIDLQATQLLLVRDKESGKWGPVAGHSLFGEKPYETFVREWREETGGLPMDFEHRFGPETIQVFKPDGTASVGFIFKVILSENFPDDHFIEDPDHGLEFLHKPIDNKFETDQVGLFNYHKVVELLINWKEKLYRPEINGDSLLDWCNSLVEEYASLYYIGSDWVMSREELGFDWKTNKTY